MQVEAGTSVTNRTGLGSGGSALTLLPQPMEAGACYWQVDGSVLAETAVERVKGGLGGKGLLPRSPQPSHAHACPPAVNNISLTTGSHLIPTASAPTPEPGKNQP